MMRVLQSMFGVVVLMGFRPSPASAGTLDLVQQVRLQDPTGVPLNAAFVTEVRVVADADPALPETVCHSASLGAVPFHDGYATLTLPSVPASCFQGPAYIEVSVDGTALLPRQPVYDVPRAGIASQVPTAASPVGCGADGALTYDTDADRLLVCDGADWRPVGAGSSVGDVRHSLLDEVTFRALNGEGWALMDGRDITGTALAAATGLTTLPDARGVVLRGKNHSRSGATGNPDGDLAVGAYQSDALGSHGHRVITNPHTGNAGGYDLPAATNRGYPYNGIGSTHFVLNGAEERVIPYGRMYAEATGANETRVRSVTVNVFVRVD